MPAPSLSSLVRVPNSKAIPNSKQPRAKSHHYAVYSETSTLTSHPRAFTPDPGWSSQGSVPLAPIDTRLSLSLSSTVHDSIAAFGSVCPQNCREFWKGVQELWNKKKSKAPVLINKMPLSVVSYA